MFEFLWWPILFLLPAPILIRFLWPPKNKDIQVALYLPQAQLLNEKVAKPMHGRWWKTLFASLIWLCIVIASARPLWFGEPISIPSEGRDLMLAVDLSRSMEQQDMLINGTNVDRLKMVKSVMSSFIDRRVGDRLGLILFADTAYLQAPLTFDREIIQQFLDESVIGLVGDSTAIGDAIGLAVKRFTQRERSNRVLVLLTDGRNTAGNISVEQALELAKSKEVTIYTIGVGADSAVQSSFFGQRTFNPSRDLDEQSLMQLAQQTGGQYFRARNAEELSQIYTNLDYLEPVEGSEQTLRPRQELFYLPLIGALLISSFFAALLLIRSFANTLKRQNVSKQQAVVSTSSTNKQSNGASL